MKAAETSLAMRPKQQKRSPLLQNAGVILRYWKLHLRELTHSEDYSTTFTQWERQIQTFNPNFQLPNRSTPMDIQEVRIQLNKATKLLRKIQKNATMSRASHKNVQKLSHAQFKEKRARAFMANFARYSNPLTIPAYHRFKFLDPPCKFIRRAEPGQVHSVL